MTKELVELQKEVLNLLEVQKNNILWDVSASQSGAIRKLLLGFKEKAQPERV